MAARQTPRPNEPMFRWIVVVLSAISLICSSLPAAGQTYGAQSSDPGSAGSLPTGAGAMTMPQNSGQDAQDSNQDSSQAPDDQTPGNEQVNGNNPLGNNPNSSSATRPGAQRTGTYVDNAGQPNRNPRRPAVAQPPAPEPTEFQRLIAASLGEMLPIFGAELFQGVPTTFAPLNDVPVSSDYVIGPGDELRVHVWGQVNFNANVKVNQSGAIYLPEVGEIHVAGLPFSALDAHLRADISRIYRNFDLSVEQGQLRSIQVFIVGQARRPGVYTVSSLSTLVNALFAAGGPSTQGSMRNIQLKRGAVTVTTFDLYDLLIKGDKTKDAHLLPGDIIFIPPVGEQVALAGSVRNPAIYELKGETTIAGLLEFAGGRSAVAGDSRISIDRISSGHSREAMEVASDAAGLGAAVRDGDLIRVLSLVPRLEKTVTIRGNLANPGHFAWRPGMHLSELIPDKDSLITRTYWLRRGSLGLPVPEFEPDTRVDRSTATDPNAPHRAGAGGSTLASTQSQVVTENTLAASGRTDVALSAPEIDWSYAVIERLNPDLTTSLVPFDLGKLVLQHDPSQDLPLQPGDVVTIFSQSDIRVPLSQQTKFVRLEGEFVRAGVFSALPGETLRQLVVRAGGLAPNSYLYGSEFTRSSTRAVQQQRLDEYVQSLEVQVQRNQLLLASSSVNPQDSLAADQAAVSQQNLLTRLRQLRATGRIVLESQPGNTSVDSLPDLPLEDGDRFIVPPRPASINVVGAVYNQNSFLYSPDRRVGDYLKLAGGPNRNADWRRAFIIRADGSVLSRRAELNLWGNGFDSVRLNPGDTLVLPEKVYKPSALRSLLDWGTLFSQFALGAAAIEVIQ